MDKTNFILVFLSLLSLLCVFFLAGCDTYEQLYGEGAEIPLEEKEGIEAEIEKTLEEVLPAEEEAGEEKEEVIVEEEDVTGIDKEIVIEGGEAAGEVEEVVIVEEKGVGEEEVVVEEGVEEEVSGEAEPIVITVQETELVSLVPEAEDPDKDKLTFTFSSPLDEEGKWQTTYGDAGEYTVTVTASDGQLTTSQDVLIIVTKKEEEPTIDSFEPEDSLIVIKETESIDFSVDASDLNRDELSYSWKVDGIEVGGGEAYNYKTTYDDSGAHTIKVDVSDGSSITSQLWSVTVENVNRKPVMEEIQPIEVKETETVTIKPVVTDPDGDEISFTISEPVGDDGIWETTYDDAGEYTVTVTASDGTDSVSQDVRVVVENVNRPPVIIGIAQKG
jgi:nitrogen fixation protein FixH